MTFQEQSDPTSQFWVFGDTFLQSHYTIFDRDQSRIGFVPNVFVEPTEEPEPEVVEDYTLILVLSILGFVLVVIATVVIVWHLCSRKDTEDKGS